MFYKYKAKYNAMEPSDARKLKALEYENAELKKLLVEQVLDNAMLRDTIKCVAKDHRQFGYRRINVMLQLRVFI